MRFVLIVFFSIGLLLSASAADHIAVLHKGDDSVGIYNIENGWEVARIAVGDSPREAVLTPDGKRLVVSNYGDSKIPGWSLSVVDLKRRKVERVIDLAPSLRPHGLVVLNNDEVLVTSEDNRAILRVDLFGGGVRKVIRTGQRVSHMLVTLPKRREAWVANLGSGTITVIDLRNERKVTDIRSGIGAEGIAVRPDEREVWVTNRFEDTVSVIEPETRVVVATLDCGRLPIRVQFTPDGGHALVSNARSGDVAVFDVKTRNLIKRVDLELGATQKRGHDFGSRFGNPSVPIGVEIGWMGAPKFPRAWVAQSKADLVSEIDLLSFEITNRFTTGSEPHGIVFLPASRH